MLSTLIGIFLFARRIFRSRCGTARKGSRSHLKRWNFNPIEDSFQASEVKNCDTAGDVKAMSLRNLQICSAIFDSTSGELSLTSIIHTRALPPLWTLDGMLFPSFCQRVENWVSPLTVKHFFIDSCRFLTECVMFHRDKFEFIEWVKS